MTAFWRRSATAGKAHRTVLKHIRVKVEIGFNPKISSNNLQLNAEPEDRA
jgi:hypothetical protein